MRFDEMNSFLRKYIKPRGDSEVLQYAIDNAIPIINPETEQFLKVLLPISKPKNILEVGTAIGYSAAFFRDITGADITTIEIDEELADIAEGFLCGSDILSPVSEKSAKCKHRATKSRPYDGNITILRGDAADILPRLVKSHYETRSGRSNPETLKDTGLLRDANPSVIADGDATSPSQGRQAHNDRFDFIFLDSSKSHYCEYIDDLVRLLAPGGVLVCDNVLFKGKVIAPEYPEKKHRTTVRHLREFLEIISSHPQLETSILPIGDGLSFSVKV